MQIGYNNDVEYRGKTFHIQTEDRGEASASIETQIFHAGAILDTSILPYNNVLQETDDVDERIARIRGLMQANHKKLYRKLFAGAYDEMVGLEREGGPKDISEVEVDDFMPSQEAVPAAALEIERGNLDAFAMAEPEGEAVDLRELQAQLARDAAAAEGAGEEEEEDAPTMMMTMDDAAITQQLKAVKPSAANGSAVVEYPRTGAQAWRGCEPPRDDLDIVNLVEKFAAG